MVNFRTTNPTNVNTASGRRITKTRLRKVYRTTEPLLQLDFFVDRNGVAMKALEQLREADRQAEEAGIKLRPYDPEAQVRRATRRIKPTSRN